MYVRAYIMHTCTYVPTHSCRHLRGSFVRQMKSSLACRLVWMSCRDSPSETESHSREWPSKTWGPCYSLCVKVLCTYVSTYKHAYACTYVRSITSCCPPPGSRGRSPVSIRVPLTSWRTGCRKQWALVAVVYVLVPTYTYIRIYTTVYSSDWKYWAVY